MAKKDDENTNEEGQKTKPEKSGGSPLVVILLALNMLLVAGVGAYVVFFGGIGQAPEKANDTVEAEQTEESDEKKDTGVTIGPIVEMQPFLVNLDEPGTNRYLKASIQLELDGPNGQTEAQTRQVPLRDLIITYLSSLNYSQTQGVVNKEIIRTSMIKQINEVLRQGKVNNLYFTEFVIQ